MYRISIFLLLLSGSNLFSQNNIGIGTAAPHTSSKLDITSNTQGALLPRMTSAQRNAIAYPAAGLLVYDTDKATLAMYDGTKWRFFFSTDKLSELAPSELTHPDVKSGDNYGYAVDISGNYAVVGAYTDTMSGIVGAGSAYIFTNAGGHWQSIGKLSCPDGNSVHNQFGKAVAIQGNRLVIAAPNNNSSMGACYYYRLINGTWVYQSKILAADGLSGDYFGFAISMDEYGMAIGAPNDDVYGIEEAGSVYTYTWNSNTNTWVPGPKVSAINDLKINAGFGQAVSIDSNRLLVGAPGYSSSIWLYNGAAYYFTRTGNIWSSPQKIVSTENNDHYYFGQKVLLTDFRAFISSPGRLNTENLSRGRVTQYTITANSLFSQPQLDNYPMDGVVDGSYTEQFGYGLAGYGSEYWAIGAPNKTTIPINTLSHGTGQVYLIRNNYVEKLYLPPGLGEQGYFGKYIEMDANSIIISAPGIESNGAKGKVFIYTYR